MMISDSGLLFGPPCTPVEIRGLSITVE